MNDNLTVWLTIAGMAAVTYMTRISGFYLSDRIRKLPAVVERLLKFLPGTIIVSIIAPQIIGGGKAALAASVMCVLAAVYIKNLVVVMITGVAAISVFRNWIFF